MTIGQVVDALYRESHERLCAKLMNRTSCGRDRAEEVVAAAYLNLLRYGRPERVTFGYAYTTALNEFYALWRREREELAHKGDLYATTQITDRIIARDRLAIVGRLPWRQRQALTDEMQGFSMRESAARRGRTYTWVDRHRKEGRAAFREAIAA